MQNAGSRNPTAEERIESIPSYLGATPTGQAAAHADVPAANLPRPFQSYSDSHPR
jgi:hypothetical protein